MTQLTAFFRALLQADEVPHSFDSEACVRDNLNFLGSFLCADLTPSSRKLGAQEIEQIVELAKLNNEIAQRVPVFYTNSLYAGLPVSLVDGLPHKCVVLALSMR